MAVLVERSSPYLIPPPAALHGAARVLQFESFEKIFFAPFASLLRLGAFLGFFAPILIDNHFSGPIAAVLCVLCG